MIKILFVCTGNICRSPMAEGILKEKFNLAKIKSHVDSCGFESFHVGDHPDTRAIAVTKSYGIDISAHRSRLFRTHDFDEFDLIFVMDSSHYKNVMKLARDSNDRLKVDYLMNVVNPETNEPVPDPWYHDQFAFEQVYIKLDIACTAIAESLKKQA